MAGHADIRTVSALIETIWVAEHPEYDDWELWNDIAVLRLDRSLVFSDTIQPAVLPTPTLQVTPNFPAVVSGWGDLRAGAREFPDILQSVVVPTLSNAECQAIYPQEVILPQHLCAGETGRDACQGKNDSKAF